MAMQKDCNGIAITFLENFLGGATDYNMTCKTLFEFLKSLFNHYPNIVLTSWRTYSKKQKSILHTRRKTHFTIARIIGDKKQSDILVILQIITIFVGLFSFSTKSAALTLRDTEGVISTATITMLYFRCRRNFIYSS